MDMVELVVRNLMSNACKFSNQGGNIYISTVEYDDCVSFKIRDEGIGMSESQREELFKPDLHGGVGTSKEKGAGIGLMISYEFIQKNNGTIEVESKQNRGATFKVSIPKAQR